MISLLRKKIVGWREWVLFPNFCDIPIKAKVDSGAETSALHAQNIHFFRKDGVKYVEFTIYPQQNSKKIHFKIQSRLVEMRKVKSSVGTVTERPVIRTNMKLGKKIFRIELTLVNRGMMGFRMLIGRKALKGKYLVDTGASFLQGLKSKFEVH